MRTPVEVPFLNVNDTEVRLVKWLAGRGQQVTQGEPLCIVESTKVSMELEAPVSGYLAPIVAVGAIVAVGSPVAVLASSPAEIESEDREPGSSHAPQIISRAARERMAALGVSEADVAHLPVVRSSDVEGIHRRRGTAPSVVPDRISLDGVAVYGTGSQAVLAHDALVASGIEVPVFLDFDVRFAELLGGPVTDAAMLPVLVERGLRRVHLALPDPEREARAERACRESGVTLTSAIHPTATVSGSADLESNVFVGAAATVGPLVHLGAFARVLTCASVAHHSRIGRGVRVSDGARVGGHCSIGARTLIGLNASINAHVTIGEDCILVSGAVAAVPVPDRSVVRSDGKPHPRVV